MKIAKFPAITDLRHVRKTITFSNTAGTVTVFTTTGRVFGALITAFCTADLIEDGAVTSIELGGATDPDALIVQTDPATIDVNEWWPGASPVGGIVQADAIQVDWMTDEDIILTITGGADLDSGEFIFDVWFFPITDDGNLS